jgi:type I restriction enzyme S subunit
MSRYKAYREYKNSGVENLGTTPSNWEVMQLRRTVLDCVNGIWGNEPENDGSDTIVIRVADFDRPKLSIVSDGFTYRKIDSKEKRSRLLARGDLLLEKSGGGEKTVVGQVVIFDKDFVAVTSNFVAKMTPGPNFSSSYLNYVFCRFYSSNINYCSIKQNTGIQNLDSASYLSEKFGFPPLHVQEKIAAFLDHETAKIDALIEKQQRLIELLKEKRQAVISHAVTKGLNPNAPMKDSGVEWLGEVPAHWTVNYLKHISSIRYGIGEPPSYQEEGVPLIRATNIRSGRVAEENLVFVNPRDIPTNRIVWLKEGDIIVVRSGAGTGDSSLIPANYDSCIAGFDMVVRPVGCFQKFIGHALLSNYIRNNQIDLEKTRAAQPHLNAEELGGCFVLLPPISEQVEIANRLDVELSKFDELIHKAEKTIGLLQERRTALISAAVTGKIDVRDWQAAARHQLTQ